MATFDRIWILACTSEGFVDEETVHHSYEDARSALARWCRRRWAKTWPLPQDDDLAIKAYLVQERLDGYRITAYDITPSPLPSRVPDSVFVDDEARGAPRCFAFRHPGDEDQPYDEVTVNVHRSGGLDGALVVQIDTSFEPDASDGGPGLRVHINDGDWDDRAEWAGVSCIADPDDND